ncbi:hypothetical protein M0812_10472 [Anaeramoeba flamelloides]|nr:hypothetical protein M0812_10472 [Anaeramoeba flamelloides]
MLTGDNQYYSEVLGKKVDALKRTCFHTLPRVLILHLKRFEFNMQTLQRYKVDDRYEFPEELNVYKYTREGIMSEEKRNLQNIEEYETPNTCYDYELVGIIEHSGTAEYGHYYSFVRERESRKDQPIYTNNKWLKCNDYSVSKYDSEKLDSDCFGGPYSQSTSSNYYSNYSSSSMYKYRGSGNKSYSAYMLLYQRKDTLPKKEKETWPKFVPSQSSSKLFLDKLKENTNSSVNKKILNKSYYNFIVELANKGTTIKENENNQQLINSKKENDQKDYQEIELLSAKVFIQFILKILGPTTESENKIQEWIKKLQELLIKSDTSGWLLEQLSIKESGLLNQIFFNCTDSNTREEFMKIIISSIQHEINKKSTIELIEKDIILLSKIINTDSELIIKDEEGFNNHSYNYINILFNKIFTSTSKNSQNNSNSNSNSKENENNNEKQNINGIQWNSSISKFIIYFISYLPNIMNYYKIYSEYLKYLKKIIKSNPIIKKFLLELNTITLLIDFTLQKKTPLKIIGNRSTINSRYLSNMSKELSISCKMIKLLIEETTVDSKIKFSPLDKYMIFNTKFLTKTIKLDKCSEIISEIMKLLIISEPGQLNNMIDVVFALIKKSNHYQLKRVFKTWNMIF